MIRHGKSPETKNPFSSDESERVEEFIPFSLAVFVMRPQAGYQIGATDSF
jgi:hypothetical protein